MIAMKSTQLNDRQSLKIIQRLRTVIPFSSDREEPPKENQRQGRPENFQTISFFT
jgi:hypothetical protein